MTDDSRNDRRVKSNSEAMLDAMTATDIILLLVVAISSVFGIAIVRRVRRQIYAARIHERDRLRQLTTDERISLARYFANQRGPWFCPLLLGGSMVALICGLILWRLGFIGH